MRSAPSPPPGAKATIAPSARMIAMLRSVARLTGPQGTTSGADRLLCGDRRHGRLDGLGHHAVRQLREEPVPDAEVGVDVPPPGRCLLELLTQLAHEDVDRAVAAGHRVAPDALVDLLALEYAALRVREQLDELELATGQVDRAVPDEGLELVGPDLHLAGGDRRGR